MGPAHRDAFRNLLPVRFHERGSRQHAGIGRQAKLPEHGLRAGQKHGGRRFTRQERGAFQALLLRPDSLFFVRFCRSAEKKR